MDGLATWRRPDDAEICAALTSARLIEPLYPNGPLRGIVAARL
jgi:hypothetical protein